LDLVIGGELTIIVLPIGYICQSLSTWTVVAVALDRLVQLSVIQLLKLHENYKLVTKNRFQTSAFIAW